MPMRRTLASICLVAFLACSSSAPPTIDSVTFGPFIPDAFGNPATHGIVAAHANAPNTKITQLAIHFDLQAQNGITMWDGPPLDVLGTATPFQVTLAFQPFDAGGEPPGTYTFQVTDSNGSTSSCDDSNDAAVCNVSVVLK